MAYDAQWVPELDETTPANSEDITFGNEAIQEVKRVLLESFPNLIENDPYLGELGQLNDLVEGNTLPRNSIIMYYPESQDPSPYEGPVGWTICDGRPRKSGGGTAPNLVSSFIMGAAPDITVPNSLAVPVGYTGGNANVVVTGQVTNGTTLTTGQIPQHAHSLFYSTSTSGDSGTPGWLDGLTYFGDNVGTNRAYKMQKSAGGSAIGASHNTGGNSAHTHAYSINDTQGKNVPPYFAALYIIKD